jgi:integrase
METDKKRGYAPIPQTSEKIDIDVLREHCENLDLTNPDNLNFWLYCKISMKTGLRSIDILELEVASIDFKKERLRIKEKKTNKEVEAPVSKDILEKIDRTKKYVIYNEKYNCNVSLMTINRRLKKLFATERNVSSHSIRKACATTIYKKTGNNIIKAMIFLNHSSPTMTKNYLGITKEEKYELYSLLE